MFNFELPPRFAVNINGEIAIGCADCKFRTLIKHICNEECGEHPLVTTPIPFEIIPHIQHAKYTTG